ncbi:MAG: lytic transglycosylase domain-containing protein [Myxococcota bacterium]
MSKPRGDRPQPRHRPAPRRRKQRSATLSPTAGAAREIAALAGPLLRGLGTVALGLALVGWVLNRLGAALASTVGAELGDAWAWLGATTGTSDTTVRLVLFGALQAGIAIAARRPARWAWAKAAPHLHPLRAMHLPDRAALALELAGAAAGGVLVIAFVLQPTLVPLRLGPSAWLARAANLLDGSASVAIADSVIGLARKLHADPVGSVVLVDPAAFEADLDADEIPLIDRWDPWLREATEGDPELFAKVKAFMWVESGGRQFAMSATGCAGLMQFCASTAQRAPFHAIFGVGRVSACGCDDCSVPRETQVALETRPDAVFAARDTFPCDLSDARFEPDKAIRAGVAYVRELGSHTGDSLPLMYVGYNAGPAVANKLYQQVGAATTVEELRPHLAEALRPHYGSRAGPRADGLLEVHLPKLLAAYARWRTEG